MELVEREPYLERLVLGGGFWIDNESVRILKSQPLLTGDGWHVLAHNTDVFSGASVTAFAICANT